MIFQSHSWGEAEIMHSQFKLESGFKKPSFIREHALAHNEHEMRGKKEQVPTRSHAFSVFISAHTKGGDTIMQHATINHTSMSGIDLELRLNSYYTVHSSEHVMRIIIIRFLLTCGGREVVDDVSYHTY
jgi:hypothetical protein